MDRSLIEKYKNDMLKKYGSSAAEETTAAAPEKGRLSASSEITREINDGGVYIPSNGDPESFDKATFTNTIEAYEQSGRLLHKVTAVFGNMLSAETNDDLQGHGSRLEVILACLGCFFKTHMIYIS